MWSQNIVSFSAHGGKLELKNANGDDEIFDIKFTTIMEFATG